MDQADFEQILTRTRNSRNYRDLFLPEDMLHEMLNAEATPDRTKSEIEQNFRKKLHNVIAPYLDSIDYAQEMLNMRAFFQEKPNPEQIKDWAMAIMQKHASTRERLPYLEEFSQTLLEHIGTPNRILDLACALDPLLLPWLDLPAETEFVAYDIHKPRVDFLNLFFTLTYPNAYTIQQDILLHPPTEPAQVAFFFKESHRFEKRSPGCNRTFFQALPVKLLIVSLPTEDLSGHHSLATYHTQLIKAAISGQPWEMEQTRVGNELLFLIHKP